MSGAANSGLPLRTDEEISSLIDVLDRTSQRLVELTGGEVDSVTGRSGHTYLLRQAQDELRQKEVAKRAIILDKQERLDHLISHDSVTGLPNRLLFQGTLCNALAQCAQHRSRLAVMCIGVDFFQNVNDSLGHDVGDELLRQFGSRLVELTRTRGSVAHLTGDQFAMMLVLPEAQIGAKFVNAIRDAVHAPFILGDHQYSVTVSIGIALHPDDAIDAESLLKHATTAMHTAKHAGRDTFRFFTAQMDCAVIERLSLEAAVRNAVAKDEFVLYYQPKVDVKTGRIAGLEALLRWQRPGVGFVLPNDFIPVLEATGLIVRLGNWVIETACRQIGQWMGSSLRPVPVSVNISGRQFAEGDFHDVIVAALEDNNLSGDLLELELTESSLMANVGNSMAKLQALKQRGVQVSIDDFGTGYSSLAHLRNFPVDRLKIDIAFIRELTSNPNDVSIVQAIIRMAHSLKLEVVAEGVETAGQLAYLRSQDCDQMQGYYFSAAVPASRVEEMLREEKRLPLVDRENPEAAKTLLLVDDEECILTSLHRLFRQDGYRILMAGSAAEGFELLARHQVQVILCDQRMPTMNGTEFLDRVKDIHPATLRIILSGYTDLKTILEAINRGSIYHFYTKPWDNRLLRENIREAFRHHRLLQADTLETTAT